MKRLIVILVGVGLAAGLAAAGNTGIRKASAPKAAAIMIRHQTRGCHAWSLNGGPFGVALEVRLARGGAITIVDNDVMPHKLIQLAGPKAKLITPAMKHMSAQAKVVFAKKGTYRFTTKPGEDYMKGMKTTGPDNVLRLTVTVS